MAIYVLTPSQLYGQGILNSFIVPSSGGSVDPDAQAFITAAVITDPTQQSAIDTLVVGLKADNLWNSMTAIYPMVGGTATQHKFNLKNPLDTDAAFRLVFNGGWTHSSTGALPNGVNAYADTKIIPSVNLSLNSTHVSYYSRTTSVSGYIFGTNNVGIINRLLWQIQGGTSYVGINFVSNNYFSYVNSNTLSLLLLNRTASNLSNAWQGGVKKATSPNPSSGLCTLPLYIGANNSDGVVGFPSNAQCAFSTIGDGLTDTDATNLYTRVQAFQTTLGRQV